MRDVTIGLLADFTLTLILYTLNADLLTSDVNLRPLTNNGHVVYQQLEPDVSSASLHVTEMSTGKKE